MGSLKKCIIGACTALGVVTLLNANPPPGGTAMAFAACASGGDLGKKPLFIGIVDRCKGDVAAAEKTFVDNVIETGNVPMVIPRTTAPRQDDRGCQTMGEGPYRVRKAGDVARRAAPDSRCRHLPWHQRDQHVLRRRLHERGLFRYEPRDLPHAEQGLQEAGLAAAP